MLPHALKTCAFRHRTGWRRWLITAPDNGASVSMTNGACVSVLKAATLTTLKSSITIKEKYHGQKRTARNPPRGISERNLGRVEYLPSRVRTRYRRFAHANFACHQGNAPGNG